MWSDVDADPRRTAGHPSSDCGGAGGRWRPRASGACGDRGRGRSRSACGPSMSTRTTTPGSSQLPKSRIWRVPSAPRRLRSTSASPTDPRPVSTRERWPRYRYSRSCFEHVDVPVLVGGGIATARCLGREGSARLTPKPPPGLRGFDWQALRNRFTDTWHEREADLVTDPGAAGDGAPGRRLRGGVRLHGPSSRAVERGRPAGRGRPDHGRESKADLAIPTIPTGRPRSPSHRPTDSRRWMAGRGTTPGRRDALTAGRATCWAGA